MNVALYHCSHHLIEDFALLLSISLLQLLWLQHAVTGFKSSGFSPSFCAWKHTKVHRFSKTHSRYEPLLFTM